MNAGFSAFPHAPSATAQHWVIAYASSGKAALNEALDTLYLPNLQNLLRQMACVSRSSVLTQGDDAFLMPHESACEIWGIQPTSGAQACITPCHWQVGMNEVIMLNPAEMGLSEDESKQLLAAIQPYFQEDGLEVVYESPLIWQAKSQLFEGLPFASLDRVVGQNVKPWMPDASKAPHAKSLQRLQSEMQMLMYQHPVNDQRSLEGRWTLNSFWVHRNLEQLHPHPSPMRISLDLRDSVQAANANQWQQTWQHLEATVCRPLLEALAAQQTISITLCSETAWQHYEPLKASWLTALKRVFRPLTVTQELRALAAGVSEP